MFYICNHTMFLTILKFLETFYKHKIHIYLPLSPVLFVKDASLQRYIFFKRLQIIIKLENSV